VYPEEVEAVLNADPRVRMSLVRPKRNPITGAIAVAEVVLEDSAGAGLDSSRTEQIKNELLEACRRALPAHKVPARVSFVASLNLSAAGKLVRPQEFA
jgi:acyl-CoA synthetase (AMP-forming)/AMP-acid ligase II